MNDLKLTLGFNAVRRNPVPRQLFSSMCKGMLFAGLAGSFTASGLLSAAHAQAGFATGSIRGTVTDPQGALIPNALVTITNPDTGITRTVNTGGDGSYQAQTLNPGTYSVQVAVSGFDKLVANKIVVTVGQTVTVDAHLVVGGSTTTVEVQGNAAALIDTAQTQQANTIDERQQVNLPNVSRNFAAQVLTLPGITDSNAASVQDNAVGTGYQSSGIAVGGGNGRSTLFTIDGGNNDIGSGALRVAHVPQDSVQEFQVNRNGEAAEFGFTTGSAINVVTKSGTNKYHGKAFGYFHGRTVDSASYFSAFDPRFNGTKPFEQSVIFGGTLGGAIKKDKLFFFLSAEHQKLDGSVTTNLVGTAAAQGLKAQSNGFTGTTCPAPVTQACYLTQLQASSDPYVAGTAAFFQGSNIFTPINDPIYNALISANSGTFDGDAGGVSVTAPPNANGRYNNGVARLDFTPSQKNNYSLRFSATRETNRVIGAGGVPRFTSILNEIQDQTITATWNHIFSGSTVNTVRAQVVPFNKTNNVAPRNGAEIDLGSLGVNGTPFDFPYFQNQNQYQFDDDLSITKGSHNLKFGFSYRPIQFDIFQNFLFGGQYQYLDGALPIIALFPTAPAGGGLSPQTRLAIFNLTHGYPQNGPTSTYLSASQDYETGIPLALTQGAGANEYNATIHPAGIYAQDAWKATKKLTLNYGGRFDIDPEPYEYPTTKRFSPRVGAAYDAYGDGKTVVRSSFGLYTAPLLFIVPFTSTLLNGNSQHTYVGALTAPNYIPQLAQIGAAERSLATPANPNPSLSAAQVNAIAPNDVVPLGPASQHGALFSVDPNFKTQYSIQAGASVEQQLANNLSLEIGYVFYRGVHIQEIQEANYVQNGAFAVDPYVGPQYSPRPGTTFGASNGAIIQNNLTTSAGESTYHGLTTSLTKRYGHGLFFQANYTWSKAIDNTSDFSSGSAPFRPGLLNLDRSLSSFDVRHSFVANAVYQTPSYRGGGGLRRNLYSDFTVAPIIFVHSGVPFTLLVPGLPSNGTQSAHLGEVRPYQEGRNLGVGPGAIRFDLRVSRGIVLKKDSNLRLDLIAQAQNVINHSNFTSVQNIFPESSDFLLATATTPSHRTTTATVATQEGNVNLLSGPYNYRGYKPTTLLQQNSPLAFNNVAPPRQISFGVELAF